MNSFGKFICFLFVAILAGTYVHLPVSAQRPAQRPPSTGAQWQINPQKLTTTPQNACNMGGNAPPCNVSIWLCEADENAAAGTAVTTTITDNQAVPIPFWSAIAPLSATAASEQTIWNASSALGCRYFPNGILVNASGNSTINFEMSGIY